MAESLNSLDPLRPLLEHLPLGVFSDIDGTLAPIVPRPADARVSPRCRELLGELIECDVRVALITGRPLDFAREMTGVEGVVYGANHGLEMWVDGNLERAPGIEPFMEASRKVLADLRGLSVDGLVIEDKGPVLAFHYRNSLNEWAARAGILDAIGRSRAAEGFVVHEGRKVVELRPSLEVNKGTALTELAGRLAVGAMVCMGDDTTDIDMFRAVERLREGGTPGVTIAVKSPEVARELLDAADYRVDGVAGVERMLGELVSALR